ncbi:MAG: tetratricopeptide repeat protein [Jejuia sp.]
MPENNSQKKWIKTFKFFAAYLVAAWTFLQFLDWILNRYNISPYWVDLLLWIFIGIIPSLLIYLYNQERINKRILKLREKIIFPLNILLVFIIVYFGFGNNDLGATTKEVSYENSLGEVETKTITKEEFRVGVPIFGFKQKDQDSTLSWLRYGIGRLLVEDLYQNKNLSPDFSHITSTTNKIREASLFYTFYVDGSYQKVGDNFEITTVLRKANNGKEIKKQVFTGSNILNLLDDISVFIAANSGFVEGKNLNYIDLPIEEFISNSLPALKAYVNGNFSKAYHIDEDFALAYLEQAKRLTLYNRGNLEARDVADKAFSLKTKLPLQKQLEVLIQRNIAYKNLDEAEKLVNLQLEVDPNNSFYNRVLYALYGETKQLEKYMLKTESTFRKDPNAINGKNLAVAAMVNGQDDRLIDEIKKYEIINPAITTIRIQPALHKGDLATASKLINDTKLQFPEYANRIRVFDTAAQYLKTKPPILEELKRFEGTYRSHTSEQDCELWIAKDRLVWYIENQRMTSLILGGKDIAIGGFINDTTFRLTLARDEDGTIYAFKLEEYYWKNNGTYWYWKIDDSILNAQNAYDEGDMEKAKLLYEIAVKNNPKHLYLQDQLSHIKYVLSKTESDLEAQHNSFAGNYGPRKFWFEDGRFYYKRKSEETDLPKVELLAVNENTYADLSRLGISMKFVIDESGKLASQSIQFNPLDETIIVSDKSSTNYFLKED